MKAPEPFGYTPEEVAAADSAASVTGCAGCDFSSWMRRVKVYANHDLAEQLAADGFDSNSPTYRAAVALFTAPGPVVVRVSK